MIPRTLTAEIDRCRVEYPVLTITGPRQSGKTTLARSAFPDHPYVSFEDPLVRGRFEADPRGFLAGYEKAAVFDEVHNVPSLPSFLQGMVDASRTMGRFVLTGSQHLGLTSLVSQSLAGRTAVLELLPFSGRELDGAGLLADDLDQVLIRGTYPPVHDRNLRPERWYSDYVATYLERDVRQVTRVHDLDTFTRFLRLAAAHVGQLVNTARMGGDLGLDHKTVRSWLSVLQATYVARLLPSCEASLRKRVVRTPRLFFYDTGLAAHLLGLTTPAHVATHPLRGALVENWVFGELARALTHRGDRLDLQFFRSHGGLEVDFLVPTPAGFVAIEVKSGMTVRPAVAAALDRAASALGTPVAERIIVHGGTERFALGAARVEPWRRVPWLLD